MFLFEKVSNKKDLAVNFFLNTEFKSLKQMIALYLYYATYCAKEKSSSCLAWSVNDKKTLSVYCLYKAR